MVIYLNIIYFSHFIIFIGLFGMFFFQRNLFYLLFSIEIVFLGLNLLLISLALLFNELYGFFIVFILFSVAGIESILGIAFVIIAYYIRGSLNFYINSIIQ